MFELYTTKSKIRHVVKNGRRMTMFVLCCASLTPTCLPTKARGVASFKPFYCPSHSPSWTMNHTRGYHTFACVCVLLFVFTTYIEERERERGVVCLVGPPLSSPLLNKARHHSLTEGLRRRWYLFKMGSD